MMDFAVFVVAAVVTLVAARSAWCCRRNPVHAALLLVMTLFGVAVLFVAQDAHFLAAVQVIVYAGAIVVLFLFVIMLLGVDKAEDLAASRCGPAPGGDRGRPASLSAVAPRWPLRLGLGRPAASAGPPAATGTENVAAWPRSLFTDYLFAFEITSVLLVIAVVGAVVLARRSAPAAEPTPSAPTGLRTG